MRPLEAETVRKEVAEAASNALQDRTSAHSSLEMSKIVVRRPKIPVFGDVHLHTEQRPVTVVTRIVSAFLVDHMARRFGELLTLEVGSSSLIHQERLHRTVTCDDRFDLEE